MAGVSGPSSFQPPVKSTLPLPWAEACPRASVDRTAQTSASLIATSLSEIESVEAARRVAEVLHLPTHAFHHCEEEVAHRRLAAGDDAPAGLEISTRASGNQGRKIFVGMAISV